MQFVFANYEIICKFEKLIVLVDLMEFNEFAKDFRMKGMSRVFISRNYSNGIGMLANKDYDG